MQQWQDLKALCENCDRCDLHLKRTNTVFGVGCETADIMFVGEGPGEQEDLKGEPFVGPAGQLLDCMLDVIDLNRKNCYITNIVKCRPPFNRDPSDAEQITCFGYLRRQVQLIKPKIIISLGRIAARQLIDPEFSITRHHGQWFYRGSFVMMGLYHPSALLRDPSKRPETYYDLLMIRDKMKEMGICPEREF